MYICVRVSVCVCGYFSMSYKIFGLQGTCTGKLTHTCIYCTTFTPPLAIRSSLKEVIIGPTLTLPQCMSNICLRSIALTRFWLF